MKYTEWIKDNPGGTIHDYMQARSANGWHCDLAGAFEMFNPADIIIYAIDRLRTRYYDDKYNPSWATQPIAWVSDGNGKNHMSINIGEKRYRALLRLADHERDYFENNSYVAFASPVSWSVIADIDND